MCACMPVCESDPRTAVFVCGCLHSCSIGLTFDPREALPGVESLPAVKQQHISSPSTNITLQWCVILQTPQTADLTETPPITR